MLDKARIRKTIGVLKSRLKEMKRSKLVILILLNLFLFSAPLWAHMAHPILFLVFLLGIFFPYLFYRLLDKGDLEEKRHRRWVRARKGASAKVLYFLRESLSYLLFVFALVFLSQYLFNGVSPLYLFRVLPSGLWQKLSAVLIGLGILSALITAHLEEKEIHYRRVTRAYQEKRQAAKKRD